MDWRIVTSRESLLSAFINNNELLSLLLEGRGRGVATIGFLQYTTPHIITSRSLSGSSQEFRRWNSFGFEQKKRRKIPRDVDNPVPTRRRSVSCRDYSQASDISLEGLERASSEHDIRGWFALLSFNFLLDFCSVFIS